MKILMGIFLLSHLGFAATNENKIETLSGNFTYRSFLNNPGLTGGDPDKVARLIFGEGNLNLEIQTDNAVSGRLDFGSNYGLDISGTFDPNTNALNLRGSGRANTPTSGWVYDYKATLAPRFKDAINQKTVLLGTVMRVVPHGSGIAGHTSSFMMIRE